MRVEFGFGIGFDRDNRPLDVMFVRAACKSILVKACQLFGGCNMLPGQGAWIDPDGNLVMEESRVLIVDIVRPGRFGSESGADDNAKIDEMAHFVRRALNQAAVHVSRAVATAKDVTVLAGA